MNLNIRVKDASAHIEPLDKKETGFGDFFTFKYIDAYGKAYIVDGQHRIKGVLAALEKAKQDGDTETVQKLENGKINISLTLTDDVYKEAYIFFLINKYARAVPPDGAHRLIVEGHKAGDLNFQNEVISGKSMDGDDISAAAIADVLARKSNVWQTRIKDFNETGAGKVSVRALTLMLKPLFLQVKATLKETGSRIDPEQKTFDIIEAYWNGLESIFEKTIFDPLTSKEYGMMKSSQSEVMFKVLTHIFKVHIKEWQNQYNLKSFGDLSDEKTWIKILKNPLESFKDKNAFGTSLKGHECWFVGKAGSMGLYTSSAAKRDIAQKLIKEIETSHGIQRSQVV